MLPPGKTPLFEAKKMLRLIDIGVNQKSNIQETFYRNKRCPRWRWGRRLNVSTVEGKAKDG